MNNKETIEYMSVNNLIAFKNHPFKSRSGDEKEELKNSIKERGDMLPFR